MNKKRKITFTIDEDDNSINDYKKSHLEKKENDLWKALIKWLLLITATLILLYASNKIEELI
ncbi:MAG: hypothetical protein FWE18_03755 [Alphaproteobacteria bacterium]|nr:hypothetical protein [Alphaproteobacteria bacterium]